MNTTTNTQDAWDFAKAVRSLLALDEMADDKIDQIVSPMLTTVRRYAEQTQVLRAVYVRIASTAERAIANIDAGFATYTNDELGSDRDRLVALHQEIATLREAIFGVRSTLQALDIDIDPFDYTNI